MNVGPYVPLPHRAAERRCYLKYIAVDGAPLFLCISCPWSPVSSPERGWGMQMTGAQGWPGWLLHPRWRLLKSLALSASLIWGSCFGV